MLRGTFDGRGERRRRGAHAAGVPAGKGPKCPCKGGHLACRLLLKFRSARRREARDYCGLAVPDLGS
eukprot:12178007-Alexandrium_andersonii.AAC.1